MEYTFSNKLRTCAVVVAYYPDEKFTSRLNKLFPQVDALIVVDNTPDQEGDTRLDTSSFESKPFQLIRNQNNLGIGVALNQGLAYAISQGCDWLLTLDQDTVCYPDMMAILSSVYFACTPKPAIIGGNYLDTHNNRFMILEGTSGEYISRKTVITSGSLIETKSARMIGGFREDYFIDQVDHEFCLRARAHNLRIVMSRKPTMSHAVGAPGGAHLPLLGTLPNHPPLRKYYIARNTLVTVGKYWRQEPEWCLRRITRLALGILSTALFERRRLSKLRAIVAGIIDGMHQRMGPCTKTWDS